MRTLWRRVAIPAALVAAGASVFSGPGTSCSSYITESTLTGADFCFIFDCQNGLFGGTVDPCPPQATQINGIQLPLFRDCPELQGP
jgi:hypothetical protein